MLTKLILILFLCLSLDSCQVNKTKKLVLTSSTEFLSLAEGLSFGFREQSGLILIVKGSLGQEKKILKNRLSDFLITSNQSVCQDQEIKCLEVGIDQLALIVNAKNPLETIDQDELVKIFSGQTKTWEKLREKAKTKNQSFDFKQKIQVLNRGNSSSLRISFDKYLLGNKHTFNPSSIIVNSNNETKTAVSRLENSIGYVSIGSLNKDRNQSKTVKQLKVYSKKSRKLIVPPRHKIKVAYLNSNKKKNFRKFISFLDLSQLSKELIKQHGYLVL